MDDGKVIQTIQDETIERRSEFTNYSHQEFIENPTSPEIPRFDAKANSRNMPSENSKPFVKERVIPITLENTGKTITPCFTKLEDPQPPEWSTFSQRNMSNQNAKENIIPIRMVDIADEESVSVAGSEYENAPKQKYEENMKPKWVTDCNEIRTSPSHSDKTGTRPKIKNPSHTSQDNSFSNKPPTNDNIGTHSYANNNNSFVPGNENKPFTRSSTEKPSIPPKPPKSPSIKTKGETTSDTKKILSKTTETTKTTTEKRVKTNTVRFNLDSEDEEPESKLDSNNTNGKRTKLDNSRMRYV